MTFGDALAHIQQSKKARREAWHAARHIYFREGEGQHGTIVDMDPAASNRPQLYNATQHDLLAKDWDTFV